MKRRLLNAVIAIAGIAVTLLLAYVASKMQTPRHK